MDKKALLSRLVAIYEEIEKTIDKNYSIYSDSMSTGMNQTEPNEFSSDATREGYEFCLEERVDASAEMERTIEKVNGFLSDNSLYSLYPSLKILVSKRGAVEPIAFTNMSLDSSYNDLAEDLNTLNELKLKIEKIIEKIESLPIAEPEQIISIQYSPEKHKLTINDKSVLMSSAARYDLLLRAFFNEEEYSLLSGEVCDGDIYLLAEDDGLLADKTKSEKRKYLLDGYKLLNDKVRKIVPGGKDLVSRVENGFVLNPELTS